MPPGSPGRPVARLAGPAAGAAPRGHTVSGGRDRRRNRRSRWRRRVAPPRACGSMRRRRTAPHILNATLGVRLGVVEAEAEAFRLQLAHASPQRQARVEPADDAPAQGWGWDWG
eukprot:scaffold59516_cov62-Phaeocystis_antarctica.AAC.2